MRKTFGVAMSATFLISSLGSGALAQTELPALPSAEPTPAVSEPTDVAGSQDLPAFVDARWRKVSQTNGPAAREDHTWTTDPAGDYAYLFGGRDGRTEFDDLWRYDLATDTWKRLRPDGRAPSARFGHSAVWAEGVGLVVFAGQQGVDFFGDLWVYDPDRDRWKLLPERGANPRKRYGSCAVIDADGKLRISHGFTFAGRFDDTRTYNFDKERWADVTPDSRKPGERCLHDCFTTLGGQIVLYGGQDNSDRSLGDLWSMRANGNWKKQSDPQAKARRLYAVTEAGPNAFIFGGAAANDDVLGDLWRVDRKTLEFTRVRTTGPTPAARSAATLVTDAKRGRLLLFAGEANSARADLWELVERATDEPDEVESDAPEAEVADASSAPEESVAPVEAEAA